MFLKVIIIEDKLDLLSALTHNLQKPYQNTKNKYCNELITINSKKDNKPL